MARKLPGFKTLAEHGFVYVDCGARGERKKRLVALFNNARYVGFEPDAAECARLTEAARPAYQFFPVAVGGRFEQRMLHITNNPGCSSLLEPNHAFLRRFASLDDLFVVTGQAPVTVVPLDAYLPSQGIHRIDFLEIDTQGWTAEILDGARDFVHRTVLGIRVECEFGPMYRDQSLFADVDRRLRDAGFELFDVDRYHVRRHGCAAGPATRGQVLWGQAIYLKDHQRIAELQDRVALAAIAWSSGFADYAAQILDEELRSGAPLAAEVRKDLERTRQRICAAVTAGRAVRVLRWSEQTFLRGLVRGAASGVAALHRSFEEATTRHNYVWRD
jgi:FkbM family methyltransferase